MMRRLTVATSIIAVTGASSATDPDTLQRSEEVMRRSFSSATVEEWQTRLAQDEVQALCSTYRNAPPAYVAARIVELSRAEVRYPDDGKLVGNWKEGEKLASIGTGGHIGSIQPDRPGTRKGGNCYACHTMATKEVAAGNLGPSLTGYGKRLGNSPETAKFVYEKIWDAQAYLPCSQMPRFGTNGWLSPQEIADTVGFLLDPESPVNR
jgi:L-cysteine S-thiosulfotransferase